MAEVGVVETEERDLDTLWELASQLAFDHGADVATRAVAWIYISFCREFGVDSPVSLETLQDRLKLRNPVDPLQVALRVANANCEAEMQVAVAVLLLSKASAVHADEQWRAEMVADAALHMDFAMHGIGSEQAEQFHRLSVGYMLGLIEMPDTTDGQQVTSEMVDEVLGRIAEAQTKGGG